MNNRYFLCLIIRNITLMLLVGLNSCQRASYSFQPVTGTISVLTEAVVSVSTLASVADAAPRRASVGTAKPAAGMSACPKNHRKPATRAANRTITFRPAQTCGLNSANYLRQAYSHCRVSQKKMTQPTPEQPRSKGVAVLLAVLLGMFGAHLFYLGNSRRALTYLITTLICIGLILIAIPVANSAVFGSGIGGVFVGICLLLLGLGGIAFTYLKALFDGVRILTNSLP